MGSTSPNELAAELLDCCLQARSIPDNLLEPLLEQASSPDPDIAGTAGRALFQTLAEPLADRFEPALCDAYVSLFSRVIARVVPELPAAELVSRYQRVRHARRFRESARPVRHVFVLSRVTLGADVAITSIVLDAAKKRFPNAEIHFVGARKGWELFAADPRLRHLPVSYGRGGALRERLAVGRDLKAALGRPESIVIDPDSRLTQLGLLPVCPEQDYFFFESRAYGGDGADSLSQLTKRWVAETFGVVDAMPYVAVGPEAPGGAPEAPGITISLGVGDNPAKRVPDPFEEELLKAVLKTDLPILVDKGAGGEEAERVDGAIARSGAPGGRIQTWLGAFAPFAARIARGRLYIGYDSAGQHVASACAAPLVSVFAGYPSERFLARWRPVGSGPLSVIPAGGVPVESVLQRTLNEVDHLLQQCRNPGGP